MNLKKIFAGFSAAALAVSAMAVTSFAEEDVIWHESGEMQGEVAIDLVGNITTDGEFPALLPEDVITIEVTTEADTSLWILAIGGFDANDEGNAFVAGDYGQTTFSATVQDVMDANGFAYEDIYGIFTYVLGPEDEDVYVVSATITKGQTSADEAGDAEQPSDETDDAEQPSDETGDAEQPNEETDNNVQPDNGNGSTAGSSDPDKGNANTGIEGVAVVAGLALVAAGAVVVARKRK